MCKRTPLKCIFYIQQLLFFSYFALLTVRLLSALTTNCYLACILHVALFPGLPTVHFCQHMEKPGQFYHVKDIQELEFQMFAKRKISLLVRNKKRMCKMHLVPLPPSVYLGRHWCHSRGKIDQAFPICFCVL